MRIDYLSAFDDAMLECILQARLSTLQVRLLATPKDTHARTTRCTHFVRPPLPTSGSARVRE